MRRLEGKEAKESLGEKEEEERREERKEIELGFGEKKMEETMAGRKVDEAGPYLEQQVLMR